MSPPAKTPVPPRWDPVRRVHWQLPPGLRAWLMDDESLTGKLVALSGGDFRVQVLSQGMARPQWSECRALGMAPRRLALVREVLLYGNDQPWVFARSVIPLCTLTGRLRCLRRLDNRPLGAFLFAQPGLSRGPIAVSCIDHQHRYLPERVQGRRPAWGRRSVFRVDGKPLLVSEVFLEAFIEATENHGQTSP